MNAIRHVIVRGRVQGVGYRAFIEDEAYRRGIGGWVRNRRDGTVEAVFTGAREIVAGMIEACRKGPPGARVDAVDENEATADELAQHGGRESFAVLPTF